MAAVAGSGSPTKVKPACRSRRSSSVVMSTTRRSRSASARPPAVNSVCGAKSCSRAMPPPKCVSVSVIASTQPSTLWCGRGLAAGVAGHRLVADAVGRAVPGGRAEVVRAQLAIDPGPALVQLILGQLDRGERPVILAVQADGVPAVDELGQHLAAPLDALAQHEERRRHALVAQQPRQLARHRPGAVVVGERDAAGHDGRRAGQQRCVVHLSPSPSSPTWQPIRKTSQAGRILIQLWGISLRCRRA